MPDSGVLALLVKIAVVAAGLGGVVTIIGLAAAGWRLARKADRLMSRVVAVAEAIGDDPDAPATLQRIVEQFETNGGATLRDVVNRIEARLAASDLRIDARLVAGDLRFDAIDRKLRRLGNTLIALAEVSSVGRKEDQ